MTVEAVQGSRQGNKYGFQWGFKGWEDFHLTERVTFIKVFQRIDLPEWVHYRRWTIAPLFAALSHRSDKSIIVYQYGVPIYDLFGHWVKSAPAPDALDFHLAIRHTYRLNSFPGFHVVTSWLMVKVDWMEP